MSGSDHSQILDMKKSTGGRFPEMGTTGRAVGLDSKLKSSILAMESLGLLLDILWGCGVNSCVTKTKPHREVRAGDQQLEDAL